MVGKFVRFFVKRKVKKEVVEKKKGIERAKRVCKKAINIIAKKVAEKTE